MNKLFDLRDTLLNCGLNIQADNLTVMTKSGAVAHYYRREHDLGNNKFQKTFDAEIFVFNQPKDYNPILYVICQWLTKNQPGHASDAIRYELDILDHDTTDVLITIKGLTETVTATDNEKGTFLGSCPPEHVDAIVRKQGVVSIDGEIDGTTE